jgi:hypothetical protein
VRPGLSVPRIYRSATDDGELSHRLFIAYDRESTSAYVTSNARVTLSHNSNRDLAAIVENVRLVKPVSQVQTVGLATNVITTGILTGSAKLWNNYRRKTPTQQPSATPLISPEELFSKHAGSAIAQPYSIHETLMPLNFVITETHSPYEHSDHRRLR